ncbi:MAG TPA: aryl-sulfate sulfotransferase, partial [Verrucomicrobiae bacterium]|nr:aryl-sulfate sulfotransferase [Verrucomicrobiae bacterium]
RVSVSVNDGTETWTHDFYDYETTHSVPLLGFKPDTTNEITVKVHDRFGNTATNSVPLVFITGPLPSDFPRINVLKSVPAKMEPGFTLFRSQNFEGGKAYICLVNSSGKVIWYSGSQTRADVRQLENGDLFIPLSTTFYELNLLGEVVKTWTAPAGYSINEHDGLPTGHGTILYLSDASKVVTDFPTSATDPNAPHQTTNILYQRVVEISATNADLLNVWSPIDMLDPTRIDYLTFHFPTSKGWDVEHSNAIIEDQRDNSLIISMRHQDAVIKFSRATGQLIWILGNHANWGPQWQKYLLTPVGTPFEWQYGQHAPELTPWGTLLLFDDGNYRASPFDDYLSNSNNYSRGVEYNINEKKMQVSQVWDYGRTNGDPIFSGALGDTEWQPESKTVLMDFGSASYVDGVPPDPYSPSAEMPVIKEVTYGPNPEIVFEITLFNHDNTSPAYHGHWVYRAHRIPDLYPVNKATRAVSDLITAAGKLSAPDQGLIAGLGPAIASIGEHDLHTAINQLHAFQQRLQAAKLDSSTEAQLLLQAQSIIDALKAGQTRYPSELLTGQWSYFTAPHALADLIESVGEAHVQASRALIGNLARALTSLGEDDTNAAVRKLFIFQRLVKVTWMDPDLAKQFMFQSQRIIEALGGGQDKLHVHLRVKGGKPWLEFSGEETAAYSVEASTDLVHWATIGEATPTGNGNFEFEDAHADQFPARYYRIVSP